MRPACLEISRKSSSLDVQAQWLAMAQYWFDLAEQRDDSISREKPPVLQTNAGVLFKLVRAGPA
jgi:hypothetical protein